METKDEMTKEVIQLDDGRYLIYYDFPPESLEQDSKTKSAGRESN